jgi:aerobic C4-dicarboxylate transport protein
MGRPPKIRKPLYTHLYVQVLTGLVLGVLVGWLFPHVATSDWMKALGDGFVKLIKMVIAPIIFFTLTSGIAHISDARKVGRIGLKALVHFEIVSTFALAIGLITGNLLRPGAGFGGGANQAAVETYAKPPARTRSNSSSTSFPTASSAPSPKAIFCRFCSFRSSSASPCWRSASASKLCAR